MLHVWQGQREPAAACARASAHAPAQGLSTAHPPGVHDSRQRRTRHSHPVALAQLMQVEGPPLRWLPSHARNGCTAGQPGRGRLVSSRGEAQARAALRAAAAVSPAKRGLAAACTSAGIRVRLSMPRPPVLPVTLNSISPSSKPSPSPVAFTKASFRLHSLLQVRQPRGGGGIVWGWRWQRSGTPGIHQRAHPSSPEHALLLRLPARRADSLPLACRELLLKRAEKVLQRLGRLAGAAGAGGAGRRHVAAADADRLGC